MAKKDAVTYKNAGYALAVTRILLGFIFLWAFLDKTFGLGFSTKSAMAWVNGGSPTAGFLQFGVNAKGPFVDFFHGLEGLVWVDWLFMFGLLAIGLALVLGVGLRMAAVAGGLLLVMMWAAELPLDTNPVLDEHLVYASVLVVLAASRREFSAFNWWKSLDYVKRNKWLW